MAAAVEDALAAGRTLLVEAGTGTGKTYAYLLPALLSGRRVLVSTGTRALQDQLVHRDLPRLLAALPDLPPEARSVALLKGRSNYLCLHRVRQAGHDLFAQQSADLLAALESWSEQTPDGDLDAWPDLTPALRARVTANAENCLGSGCPEYDRCFVVRARREAQKARMVVVNHALLFSDFRLREEGFAVLPGAEAVIVDEAHQLPELAPQFFGERLSLRMLEDLVRAVLAQAQEWGDLAALDAITRSFGEVLAAWAPSLSGNEARLPWEEAERRWAAIGPREIQTALAEVIAALAELESRSRDLAALADRARLLAQRLELFVDDAPPGWVRWLETAPRGGALQSAPVESAEAFGRMFERYPGAWIFTSATLAVGDDFSLIQRALGLEQAATLRLSTPFDYMRQARLMLAGDALPNPNDDGYVDAVVDWLAPLLIAVGGGAFLLCNSLRAMTQAAAGLRRHPATRALQILMQGEAGKGELLRRFEEDGNAVLVATASFREGVDVRGRALRLVAVDRLPFVAQGDPLLDARVQALRDRGGNPFRDYLLPRMLVTLRQAVGRLIRDVDDRGLVVLCDPRVGGSSYGRAVLRALPEMPRVETVEAARAWLALESAA
jgi:Rad3-related DNA helicases